MKRLIVMATAVPALSGCFALDRADELAPGTVRGRGVFGGDAVDVTAAVTGAVPVRAAGGSFVVGGLPVGDFALRLSDDIDDDGRIDRGAALRFNLPERNDGAAAGVDLGDVALAGAVSVSGSVVDEDGLGLAGAVVVVARLDVDGSAEVSVPVVSGAFSLLAVPGKVSIVVVAPGNRQSNVVEVDLTGDVGDLAFAVRAAPPAHVTGNLVPAAAGVSVVAVPVGGSIDDGVASGNAGVFFDVEAGVYDAFFVEDGEVVGFVGNQLALADTNNVWGPAVRGAFVAEGEGEGEVGEGEGEGEPNTPPTLTTVRGLRLVPTDGTALSFTIETADADGDVVTITNATFNPSVALGTGLNQTTGAIDIDAIAPADSLFARTTLEVTLSDGTDSVVVSVADLVVADAAFVGSDAGNPTDPALAANWVDGKVGSTLDAVWIDSGTANFTSPIFAALGAAGIAGAQALVVNGDILVEDGGSVAATVGIDVGGDFINNGLVSAPVVNFVGGGKVTGPFDAAAVRVAGGVIVDVDGFVRAGGACNVEGALEVGPGDNFQCDGDLTVDTNGALNIDSGVTHMLGSTLTLNGALLARNGGAFSFGFLSSIEGTPVTVTGTNVSGAQWDGLFIANDAVVTWPPLGSGVPLVVNTLTVEGSTLQLNFDNPLNVATDVDFTNGGTIVAAAGTTFGGALHLDGGTTDGFAVNPGDVRTVVGGGTVTGVVTVSGTLVIGDGVTPASTSFGFLGVTGALQVLGDDVTVTTLQSSTGSLELSGAQITVLGTSGNLSFADVTADAGSTLRLGDGTAKNFIFGDTGDVTAFADLVVTANTTLQLDGDLTVANLTIEDGGLVLASASGSMTATSCTLNGSGAAQFGICP